MHARWKRRARARASSAAEELASGLPGGAACNPRFLAIGGGVPTDAFTAPTSAIMQTVDAATLVPLLFDRGRRCSFLVAPTIFPFPSQGPNNSPTLAYSVLRPRLPWPVGGQANVRESSSVAAHMHATASDRCTTSRRRRRRSRSCSYLRRSASRKLSSKCLFDHAEREGRVDRLIWLIPLTSHR